MWITADVNIPQQLLNAAARDEVVFFVGAGASFNPPSNLPSYKQLATMLADEADESLPCDDEQLDRFIGMLPDNFNVHKRTKDIMRGDDIHCNSTHEAIVRLASSVKTPRIVTTNYDLLLEEAAQKQNCDLGRSYYGPAVPIGKEYIRPSGSQAGFGRGQKRFRQKRPEGTCQEYPQRPVPPGRSQEEAQARIAGSIHTETADSGAACYTSDCGYPCFHAGQGQGSR